MADTRPEEVPDSATATESSPTAGPDAVDQTAFDEDTVEIPLEADDEVEPVPGSTVASQPPSSPSKDLPPSPTVSAPVTAPVEPEPAVDKMPAETVNGEGDSSTSTSDRPADISPPPPPPKSQPEAPETPAKPSLPRETSKVSLQDVELSRGPTPHDQNTAPPLDRTQSSASSRHAASASVTSLASVTSPSRPASAAYRPRMTGEHSRRSSVATTISLTGPGAASGSTAPKLSSVLITPPLKVLVDSKEAKKSASFAAAAQRALELCSQEGPSNSAYLHPREIFEPLRLAISNPQTTSVPILITSLDLLSKLVSHSFFSEPDGPPKGMSPLPDLITHTIILAYSESSPPQVALQVVKALMAIVLSTDRGMLVHQSSLLKAVRTVYNVFILSNDAANQVVAQGGLTQMVHHVFGRVIRPNPNKLGRRDTVSENEARRLERESEEAAAALLAAESGDVVEPTNGEPKMTL